MDLKVSVVIPIYNAEKYIERCVNSVLSQSYKNIEIILVDDCSKDNSLLICKAYENENDNVIVISHLKNGGQLKARNSGMNAASGDALLFLDSDDAISENAIEKMVYALDQSRADFVLANYKTIKGDEENVFKASIEEGKYERDRLVSALFSGISLNVLSCIGSKLYKMDFIKNRKKKTEDDITTNADMAFALDAIYSCDTVYYMDEVVYEYFLREGSITYSYRKDAYLRIKKARAMLKPLLVEAGCFKEKQMDYAMLCYGLINKTLQQEVQYRKGYNSFLKAFSGIRIDAEFKEIYEILKKGNYLKAKLILLLIWIKKPLLMYALYYFTRRG